jgi:transglutaminase-like putative cysteine protease
MRISAFVRRSLLLLLAASPAVSYAQFQDPTPEELKMTAYPKAPGAPAVYLYREQTTIDSQHFESFYERIKVLTEKGKDLATVKIPYEHGDFKVTDIQARTIHPDGTIFPLIAKPTDLTDFKTKGYQLNTIVFTLPNVEVGCILEYRLKMKYDEESMAPPVWNIQQPYLVQHAHYFFHPTDPGSARKLMYQENLGNDQKVVVDKKGNYTLDLTDVPATPDEDWMPPLNTINWRVKFYYSAFSTGTAFWESATGFWSREAEDFMRPTPLLKKAAEEIVSPGDSEQIKAQKIYAAVMKLDNTDFTRTKSEAERKKEKLKEIHIAEDVWKQQSGSASHIALLYVALARAAGLTAWPMQVVNRDRAVLDGSYLSRYQLDDYIAIVSIGGKEVYLDPGQKMCPFGALHWKHTLAGGFRSSEKGTAIDGTPAASYKSASVQRIADLTVTPDGNVSGTVRFVMTGPEALHWRQAAILNDTDEVKKQFNESLRDSLPEGVHADFDHFLGLDEYNSSLMGIVHIDGSLAATTGKHFFLPGQFFESQAKHPFVAQEQRITPVDVHFARLEQDDVTYHLPDGYTVESAPPASSIPWPNHAMFKIASNVESGSVTVERTMAYNFTVLSPKEYPSLHDFFQKVATADQQQLVLVRAAQAKGN